LIDSADVSYWPIAALSVFLVREAGSFYSLQFSTVSYLLTITGIVTNTYY